MTQAQKVFEAMMRAKGYTDFSGTKGRYSVPALQTRWNYFLLGWEMRGVTMSIQTDNHQVHQGYS
jgi:hypothetical protein